MKISEIINGIVSEAMSSQSPIEWQKTQNAWIGEFQTANGRWFSIRIGELNREQGWAFEFSEIPEHALWLTGRAPKPNMSQFDYKNPVGSLAPTGRGEAFLVYATVISAMNEFLREIQPDRVRFKGATGRQTILYRTLLKRYSGEIAALGYRIKGAGLVRTVATP